MSLSSCRSWIKPHFGMIPGQHFFLHSPLFLTNSVKDRLCFTLFCCFVHSEFQDIFDVDYFIASLREEVRILKELPPRLKKRVEQGFLQSMPPVSWSDISYYHNQVCLHLSSLSDVSKSYAHPYKGCNWLFGGENRFCQS
jgi:hypothetical protein